MILPLATRGWFPNLSDLNIVTLLWPSQVSSTVLYLHYLKPHGNHMRQIL